MDMPHVGGETSRLWGLDFGVLGRFIATSCSPHLSLCVAMMLASDAVVR